MTGPVSMEMENPHNNNNSTQKVDAVTLKHKSSESVFGGLPFEPPRDAGGPGTEPARILRQLRNFYQYGLLEADQDKQPPATPALLYPYLDLSSIRHDYPVCINALDADNPIRSLTAVIDQLANEVAAEGEAGERLRRQLYQLESVMRMLADQDEAPGSLLGLWDRAAKILIESSQLDKDKEDQLRENLGLARNAITVDQDILACNQGTALQLTRILLDGHWRSHCREWRKELDSLIRQLQDILDADFNLSTESKSARHLSESSGVTNEEIDFTAMSDILKAGTQDHRLPAERRQRIETALATLRQVRPVYAESSAAGGDEALPLPMTIVTGDSAAALAQHERRMEIMTSFFKAVNIARLEAANHYREAVHDPFFAIYDARHLTASELSLCPPVVLGLRSSELNGAGGGSDLLKILNSSTPVKILLQIDDLSDDTGLIGWPAHLAGMAMGLANAYVMQAPVARLPMLQSGIRQGLEFAGPALFSIYVGHSEARPGLPVYLDAAATLESRILPAFSYNPAAGKTLRQRINILENPQCDQDWSVEPFTYRTPEGSETGMDLAFTPADFLLADQRLVDHFWTVPVDLWHEDMLPLHEYLQLEQEDARIKVPYLLTVDQEGLLGRVVMTRIIIETTLQCAAFWSNLQETGGINNSFVAEQVAAEKEHLEQTRQEEIAAIEKQYSEQLDQDLGKLTETIIQRIASQLVTGIAGSGVAGLALAEGPARPAPDAAPEPAADETESGGSAETAAAETAAVDEDEDEDEDDDTIASLDEAYIETPRCTTCDECTKLNPQIFAYDDNKQAYIKDAAAGPYKDMVRAAELCPVKIIHPGKPLDESEANLEDLIKRAEPFM